MALLPKQTKDRRAFGPGRVRTCIGGCVVVVFKELNRVREALPRAKPAETCSVNLSLTSGRNGSRIPRPPLEPLGSKGKVGGASFGRLGPWERLAHAV